MAARRMMASAMDMMHPGTMTATASKDRLWGMLRGKEEGEAVCTPQYDGVSQVSGVRCQVSV